MHTTSFKPEDMRNSLCLPNLVNFYPKGPFGSQFPAGGTRVEIFLACRGRGKNPVIGDEFVKEEIPLGKIYTGINAPKLALKRYICSIKLAAVW